MIKSMTGYGYFKQEDKDLIQIWEIKSLNSKQFNVRFHLPHFLMGLETVFEEKLKTVARRGKIDVFLTIKTTRPEFLPVSFDTASAEFMLNQINRFAKHNKDSFKVDYNVFLTSSRFWTEEEIDREAIKPRLLEGLTCAIENWDSSRIREGQKLRKDLLNRAKMLKDLVKKIEKRAPVVLKTKWETLQQRINDLLSNIVDSIDKNRLLQEFAILTDRLDITEEIVRLKSHIGYLIELLEKNSAEGRRLDFVFQECLREITTCANKSQDFEVSKIVVEFKTELEKCREQVQNLE